MCLILNFVLSCNFTCTQLIGAFMIDVEGSQHLDCCNNVACVGHGHPAVVEAGRRELVCAMLYRGWIKNDRNFS